MKRESCRMQRAPMKPFALSLSKGSFNFGAEGFDKLSPNGTD